MSEAQNLYLNTQNVPPYHLIIRCFKLPDLGRSLLPLILSFLRNCNSLALAYLLRDVIYHVEFPYLICGHQTRPIKILIALKPTSALSKIRL